MCKKTLQKVFQDIIDTELKINNNKKNIQYLYSAFSYYTLKRSSNPI